MRPVVSVLHFIHAVIAPSVNRVTIRCLYSSSPQMDHGLIVMISLGVSACGVKQVELETAGETTTYVRVGDWLNMRVWMIMQA